MTSPEFVYPWDQSPEWAMWAATDSGGGAFWYARKPHIHEEREVWSPADDEQDYRPIRADGVWFSPSCPHWRDTLERRPTDPRTEQQGGA